ncbi:MAG: Orotate phosphoribosyltransferase [Parcubacteria group bacterium GW2011_GWA2_42_14]|nr:MAG: Orotate phosphoribosyltransferase [Parcubacteria group bacterium GW2011_GWA2_42_14]
MSARKKELTRMFVWRSFKEAGAIIENSHFVYVSGRHGSVYIDHHAIYTVLKAVSQMCRFMAEDIYDLSLGCEIEVVLGPEGGGIILSRFLKEHLDRFGGKRISLWAKKQYGDNGLRKFVLPRAFIKHISGKKVFLIDDILTSGSTFYELTELANRYGANVVGLGCLWNRGGVTSGDLGGIPLFSLFEKRFEDFDKSECPFCESGIPINNEFGHGRNLR